MNSENHNLLPFPLIILTFACIFVIGNSQDLTSYPCVTQLIPCQASLSAPSEPPPASCCRPLNQLLASANDTKCLCSILENPIMMQSLNVTKADAFKLAKACGSKSSDSLCQSTATPPSSSTSPPANSSSPSNGAATTPTAKKNAAIGLSSCHGFPLIVLITLILLQPAF